MRSPGAFAAAAREFSIAGTDIVLIQEPPVRLPKWINTYKVLAAEGVERCRAGILVRKEVPHRITLAGRDYIEAEVKLEGASRWITISSIYLDRDIDVEMVLNRIKGNGWKVVGGDLNSLSTEWCSDVERNSKSVPGGVARGQEVEKWALTEGFSCINTNEGIPTFRNSRWSSSIDAVFLGNALVPLCLGGARVWEQAGIPSDHEPLIFSLSTDPCKGNYCTTKKGRRNPRNTDWDKFGKHMARQRVGGEILRAEDLENRARALQDRITQAVRLSTRRSTTGREGSKEWWTPTLDKLRKNYQRERGRARAHQGDSALHAREVEARRSFLKAIKKRKREFTRKFIEDLDETSVKRWEKGVAPGESLNHEEVLDRFVGEARQCHTVSPSLGSLDLRREVSLNMEDVRAVVESLPRKRRGGDDDVAYEHFKAGIKEGTFLEELWRVLEGSLRLGIFPRCWKTGLLITIPKPKALAEEDRLKRYRPVTLLRAGGKILEKVIVKQWVDKQMPPEIHGFVRSRSCITALRKAVEWAEARPKSHKALLFEDVKGAFDNCGWKSIIEATSSRVGKEWEPLVASSLSDRKVRYVGEEGTGTRYRKKGVSQGSGLSPILYAFHSVGIAEEISKGPTSNDRGDKWEIIIIIYADDVCIAIASETADGLKEGIRTARASALKWAEKEHMELAPQKEELLVCGGRAEGLLLEQSLPELSGKVKHEVKWLGVWLHFPDKRFNWNKQAKEALGKVESQLSKLVSICRRSCGLKSEVIEAVWHKLVIPRVTYACEIWGHMAAYKWFAGKASQLLARVLRWAWRALRSTPSALMIRISSWKQLDQVIIERYVRSNLFRGEGRPRDSQAARKLINLKGKPEREVAREVVDPEAVDTQGSPEVGEGSLQYFTDGSKFGGVPLRPKGGRTLLTNHTGCGVIEVDPNGRTRRTQMLKLPSWATVYQSELTGIIAACKLARIRINSEEGLRGWNGKVEICADNMTALKAAGGQLNKEASKAKEARLEVRQLKEVIGSIGGEVKLRWVKAHRGHLQNAQADWLAKMGGLRGTAETCPVSWAHAKEMLTRQFEGKRDRAWGKVRNRLKTAWARLELGAAHRRLLEGIKLESNDRRRLIEAISGHSCLRDHWVKIDRNSPKGCRGCGHPVEDGRHIIFDCPKWRVTRDICRRKMGTAAFPKGLYEFLRSKRRLRGLVWLLARIWPDRAA